MAEAKAKGKNHYVDNAEFLQEMIAYRKSVISAQNRGWKKKPRVPDEIGTKFMKIAEHLSYKPNFINYTFRDDMIGDGVENCVQYIDNFDPEKSSNPFAYFTQIIYYAFLRRIQKEKKQLYTKYKLLEQSGLMEDLVTHDKAANAPGLEPKLYENMQDFIKNYEESMQLQKDKAAAKKAEKNAETAAK